MVTQMMNHRNNKFQKVFKIQELEFVIKFILENHRDRLFTFTGHMQKTNYEIYSKVIDSWLKEFDK